MPAWSNSPVPPNSPVNPFADDSLSANLEWLFSKAGYVGVSFFFVLSGFVLTWSSSPTERMRSFWRRRFAGPAARWFGEISFGFYISQGVVIFYGRTLFGDTPFETPMAVLVAAVLLAAALVSGWLLYTMVERPIMRRWARPRSRPGYRQSTTWSEPASRVLRS